MCSLYNLKVTRWELLAYFKAQHDWRRDMAKDYVSPGRPGFVVTTPSGSRCLTEMRWGWPPPAGVRQPVVNVRNTASPFWRSALEKPERRCLVPAILRSMSSVRSTQRRYLSCCTTKIMSAGWQDRSTTRFHSPARFRRS